MKRIILILIVGLPMSLASIANAELVGWWAFDEGLGNIAKDSSQYPYINNGSLNGPDWVITGPTGTHNYGLYFNGKENDFVRIKERLP